MQHERFLLINRLLEHGFALEKKLKRVRASVRDVLQADAQAWYDLYMAWYSDTVPQLDADLQARLQTAHLGTDAGPGTKHLLELLVQACDEDPAIAAPAYESIRPQFWHAPLGDPLHNHLETLETARRRTFPATHAVPGEVKDAMAAACWRFHDETIDHIFINHGCGCDRYDGISARARSASTGGWMRSRSMRRTERSPLYEPSVRTSSLRHA